jgi:biopolymer transport protein ExbB
LTRLRKRLPGAVAVLLLVFGPGVYAQTADVDAEQPMTLSDLVQSVRDSAAVARARLAEREQRFIAARDERRKILQSVRTQRQAAEREADQLRRAFEQAEEDLAELETQLDKNAGDLREVFAVVRQVAGDVSPVLQNSLVSAQLEGRIDLVERLSSADANPTAQEMRELWLTLLDEMEQSGLVARFTTPVIAANGEEQVRQVTRIGTFNALADGQYLRYLPESGKLLALARQPAGTSAADALGFEQQLQALSTVAIDPSRGAILALIVQTPEVRERVQQGGLIGYLILLIGAVGLVLGAYRFFVVLSAQTKLRADGRNDGAPVQDRNGHALAQLRAVAADDTFRADANALAAKLDEVVATQAERLSRGLPTLAIFAAVSPLLGLLGTVTGMIETFQVITLFGAGDPRLMSGGISQALITTQLVLAVAIPLLLLHSFLQGRANRLIALLDQTATELFARQRGEGAQAHAG